MALDGSHLRTVGEGTIDANVCCIAVRTDASVIAVGTASSLKQVLVFDFPSGALMQTFGGSGPAEGQLAGSVGMRFTPEGDHLLIAESLNNRLSLFTVTGEFVRCIGAGELKSPMDVEFANNADILVADKGNRRICVFSPDGSTLLRSFGIEPPEGDASDESTVPGVPIALAMSGRESSPSNCYQFDIMR